MILAVLASLIISTEEANTFFTTPSWMPTEISSERTPGSDDFIGFDYEVVTNVVYSDWVYDELSSFDWEPTLGVECWLGTYPQWNGVRWSKGSSILNDEYSVIGELLVFDPQVDEDPEDGTYNEHSISLTYNGNADLISIESGEVVATCPGKAVFNRTAYTNVVTNVFCRVDKWYGANVTATMNAMLEREYFFNAGNFGDEWITEVDGPRSNKAFWFEDIGGTSPHLPFIYKSPFVAPYAKYEWSNNASWRTIESRRFVEYGNLQRLVSSLDPSKDLSLKYGSGWIFGSANRIRKNGWRYWNAEIVSSSLLKSHGMTDLPNHPDFTNYLLGEDFHKTVWSLGGLAFGQYVKATHKLSHAADVISKDICFGWTSPCSEYDCYLDRQPSQINTLHYTNVLSCANFNIEDDWIDDTDILRRPSSDTLTECNMMLAAMDRNVVSIGTLAATGTVTKTFHNNVWTHYEPQIAYVEKVDNYSYRLTSRIIPENGILCETNYVETTTNYGIRADSQFLFVSDAREHDSASWNAFLTVGGMLTEPDFITWASEVGFIEEEGRNLIHIVGQADSFYVWGGLERHYPAVFEPASTNAIVIFGHAQNNSYTYQRELEGSELGDIGSYPSDQAINSGRVRSCKLNIVTGKCLAKYYGENFDDHTPQADWTGRNVKKDCNDGNIVEKLSGDDADIRTKLEAEYGDRRVIQLNDWQNKIPINSGHFNEIANTETNMFIDEGTVLSGTPSVGGEWIYTSEGKLYEVTSEGLVEIPSKEINYSSALEAEAECPYKYDVIKAHGDRLSFRVRKVGVIETDWNFKSMKRE